MNDSVFAATSAELNGLAHNKTVWMALVGAGALIGVTGPFGTYETIPFVLRGLYWVGVSVPCFWLGYAVSFAVASTLERAGLHPAASLGAGALVASLPVTTMIAMLHAIMFQAPFWSDAVRLLPYVALISVAVAVASEALAQRKDERIADADPRQAPPWVDRIPIELGRDLIVLQAQDHYLRAETTRGETLLRGGLRDAAEELGDYGIRLHRSWWVARHAIDRLTYRNGAPVMRLRDGREVPVGRTYLRAARGALQAAPARRRP